MSRERGQSGESGQRMPVESNDTEGCRNGKILKGAKSPRVSDHSLPMVNLPVLTRLSRKRVGSRQ